MGSLDTPFNPVSLALGAEATFVGRALDSDKAGLTEVLTQAARHRGSALVEIYQNCPIFNDGAFDVLKDKDEAAHRIIPLTAGEPIRFGPEREYGVTATRWGGLEIGKVADIAEDNLVVHDPTIADTAYAFALSRLGDQHLDHTPTGVFRDIERPTYDDQTRAQVDQARAAKPADLQALLKGKDTWTVV
jgi:2-oxoglutarate/2-oxoacid ferredoxin oxidoreductase subunit beta